MTREEFMYHAGLMVDDLEEGDFVLFRLKKFNEETGTKEFEVTLVVPEDQACDQNEIIVVANDADQACDQNDDEIKCCCCKEN